MLISLCTPVMNRLDDLRQVMPARIAEANASPPVELCILDCSSTDGLQDYMNELVRIARVAADSYITYKRIDGITYYHQAKGYNAAMMLGGGEYLVTMGADHIPNPGFIDAIREAVFDGHEWGYVDKTAIIYCHRDDFIHIGGYDERFEFYGPEDKDIMRRLRMLLGAEAILPRELISNIDTPDSKKVANYRLPGTKHTFSEMMRKYYLENIENNTLVVNMGKELGKWN